MLIRETLTYEHEDGDIFFDILVDTEDGSHEIEWSTVERNFEYYSPDLREINYMQEIAEEEAETTYNQWLEEKNERWDD
jgi:hypothetical protein